MRTDGGVQGKRLFPMRRWRAFQKRTSGGAWGLECGGIENSLCMGGFLSDVL